VLRRTVGTLNLFIISGVGGFFSPWSASVLCKLHFAFWEHNRRGEQLRWLLSRRAVGIELRQDPAMAGGSC